MSTGFYWNTAPLISLHFLYVSIHVITVFNGCYRGCMAQKPEIFTIQAFTEKIWSQKKSLVLWIKVESNLEE